MRRCDANRADRNKKYFRENAFFKKYVGENNETDAADEEKQSPDPAVLFKICGQQSYRSYGNRETDENIFDAFARQERYAEQRQKGNQKRHRQTMDGAKQRQAGAGFIQQTVRVKKLKV